MNLNIFPTVTTCPRFSWRYKLQEIKRLGLKEVSVFPTFMLRQEREKFYQEFDKSGIKWVPHLHVRDDFKLWEFEYFWKKYKTRYFNHHENFYRDALRWQPYMKNLYIEFNYDNMMAHKTDLSYTAGLCVDFSHLWAAKQRGRIEFEIQDKYASTHGVGCNHLNGYSEKRRCDLHYVSDKHQLDYLKEIPKKFFGKIISLEMNNSIEKQLEYKSYIEKILR